MKKTRLWTLCLALCLLTGTLLTGCSPADTDETTQATEETKGRDIMADGELNILLLGNSYSYYYPDELWGLLNAAGYQNVTICNIYYSGCTFAKHWGWYLAGESHYRFCINDKNGRSTKEPWNLEQCLAYKDWDMISMQQSGSYMYSGGVKNHRLNLEPYMGKLHELLTTRFPEAKMFWLQSWTHEIGYGVADLEEQKTITQGYREVSVEVCEKYGLTNIPCGDAWEKVRHDPMITAGGKALTTRIYKGQPDYDDLSHDGDVGGGQYLNACVWFETLMGKSCLNNTFRPNYQLDGVSYNLPEEKIALLKKAAHEAVAEMYGADYAK